MLEVRGLSVFYGRHRAVETASLTVAEGEIVVLLGANGAGKSSLLRALAGLTPAAAGASVIMDGREIAHRPPDEIVDAGLALVPEDRAVFADLTVHDNLRLGAYPRHARGPAAENMARVLRLFPKLDERRKQKVRTSLIGGGGYALGVLLLGPGLTYPPHAHPANEVYYIVGGSAEWRRGDGPWTSRATGSLVQHPSGLVHATRTGDDPLLALYLWWGDIETHARLMPSR